MYEIFFTQSTFDKHMYDLTQKKLLWISQYMLQGLNTGELPVIYAFKYNCWFMSYPCGRFPAETSVLKPDDNLESKKMWVIMSIDSQLQVGFFGYVILANFVGRDMMYSCYITLMFIFYGWTWKLFICLSMSCKWLLISEPLIYHFPHLTCLGGYIFLCLYFFLTFLGETDWKYILENRWFIFHSNVRDSILHFQISQLVKCCFGF